MAKGKSSMTIQGIVAMAIGILSLVIVYAVIPMIGEQVDSAIVIGATSEWNSSVNTDVPTAVSLWTSLAGILKVAAFIIIIGGFLRTLQGMRS